MGSDETLEKINFGSPRITMACYRIPAPLCYEGQNCDEWRVVGQVTKSKKYWKNCFTDLLSIGCTETAHVEIILFNWRKIKQSNVHCVQLNDIQ